MVKHDVEILLNHGSGSVIQCKSVTVWQLIRNLLFNKVPKVTLVVPGNTVDTVSIREKE